MHNHCLPPPSPPPRHGALLAPPTAPGSARCSPLHLAPAPARRCSSSPPRLGPTTASAPLVRRCPRLPAPSPLPSPRPSPPATMQASPGAAAEATLASARPRTSRAPPAAATAAQVWRGPGPRPSTAALHQHQNSLPRLPTPRLARPRPPHQAHLCQRLDSHATQRLLLLKRGRVRDEARSFVYSKFRPHSV